MSFGCETPSGKNAAVSGCKRRCLLTVFAHGWTNLQAMTCHRRSLSCLQSCDWQPSLKQMILQMVKLQTPVASCVHTYLIRKHNNTWNKICVISSFPLFAIIVTATLITIISVLSWSLNISTFVSSDSTYPPNGLTSNNSRHPIRKHNYTRNKNMWFHRSFCLPSW